MLQALINSLLPYDKITYTAKADDSDGIIDIIVGYMWEFINRDAKDKELIVEAKKLTGATDYETARNIYNYVVKLVPYKSDPVDRERLTAPIHLLKGHKKGEDCDGMVMLANALLTAANIKNRILVIAWRKPEFTHVVSQALVNGNWIEIDCTIGNGGGFDVKNRKIIRTKYYGNPMELKIETLQDDMTLSDCSCKNKRNKQAENVNVNFNPILIGNDLDQKMANYQNGTQGGNTPPQVIEKKIPVEKIVTRTITRDPLVKSLFMPKADPNEKIRPTLTLKKGAEQYKYPYFY